MEPTALDKIISYLSPQRGAERMRWRMISGAMAGYEGASRSKRTSNWKAGGGSANSETRSALTTLRHRHRDLVRNNAYAAAAVREIPAHMVGTGIIPQVRARSSGDQQRYEELVHEWFETTACDAEGVHNFYGLQNLAARTIVEAGEVMVRQVINRDPSLPLPLQLHVIEPDHLDHTKDGHLLENGNKVIQGVEVTPRNERVAYWIFPEHPGDHYMRSLVSERVPAEQMIHAFRVDRPGQVRGVPWGAPVLMRLRDFDEYEDAQLVRQKIAACFAAFMYNPDPMSSGDASAELPDKLEPGMLEELPGGRDIRFADPPSVEGYGEYSRVTLHEIATGYGIPYPVLTGDQSQANFSSARMGWLSFSRSIQQWTHNMLVPQMCMPVWRWFNRFAAIEHNLGRADVKWSAPRRPMVDPAREVPALRDAVRSGQITQMEAIRQQGYDPTEFLEEVRQGNEVMDQHGIVFDSDPRKTSGAGLTQARPEDSELPPTSGD